ncbi:MAG: queuosine precursor transporter [Ignavibacteria bacterium]|nr:queuosine precursor transporter [Ignavibacteria bacterium]
MTMDKRLRLYTILSSVFLSALILAEITGSKLVQVPFIGGFVFTLTMGVVPFPVTFIVTDIINEYYGRKGIRFVTFVGMAMILLVLAILQIDMSIPAASFSPVGDEAFNTVFGASTRIIVGSLTAYLIGQLVDIAVFHWVRQKTGSRMLWLRATGSTVVSQLIDSFVVLFIAFSGVLSVDQIVEIGFTNYIYKFLIAVGITPLLYLLHGVIDRYLGMEQAKKMMEEAHSGSGSS